MEMSKRRPGARGAGEPQSHLTQPAWSPLPWEVNRHGSSSGFQSHGEGHG